MFNLFIYIFVANVYSACHSRIPLKSRSEKPPGAERRAHILKYCFLRSYAINTVMHLDV
jgi:hypothetical protein